MLAMAGMLAFIATASADPVFVTSYNYDGHTYSLYADTGIHWQAASDWAISKGQELAVLPDTATISAVYAGLIGNGFFTKNDGQAYSAWLGATPSGSVTSTTSRYDWSWVDGTAWTDQAANNFASNEPNGDSEGLSINRYGNFSFNDEGGFVGGFITESVPDGATTIMLLGGSLCGIGMLRRKLNV